MSLHNFWNKLWCAYLHEEMKALYVPALGGHLLAWGDTVPSDGASGYAKGCIFIHTDASGNSDVLYVNIGSASSCNFNAVSVASD